MPGVFRVSLTRPRDTNIVFFHGSPEGKAKKRRMQTPINFQPSGCDKVDVSEVLGEITSKYKGKKQVSAGSRLFMVADNSGLRHEHFLGRNLSWGQRVLSGELRPRWTFDTSWKLEAYATLTGVRSRWWPVCTLFSASVQGTGVACTSPRHDVSIKGMVCEKHWWLDS